VDPAWLESASRRLKIARTWTLPNIRPEGRNLPARGALYGHVWRPGGTNFSCSAVLEIANSAVNEAATRVFRTANEAVWSEFRAGDSPARLFGPGSRLLTAASAWEADAQV
jgi:hypothetical protein